MLRIRSKDIFEKKLIAGISKTGEARNIGLTTRANKVLVRREQNLEDEANAFQICDRYAKLFKYILIFMISYKVLKVLS